MLKFCHTADWHPRSMGTIGGKLVIDPDTGLSRSLTDFCLSLDFLYTTLHEKQIDLLLLAGDVFDTHKPSMDEIRVVLQFLERCRDEMQVVVIAGNHDIAQSGQLSSALTPIRFIPGIRVIERPQRLMLQIRGQFVRVDCLPYPSRGRLIPHLGTSALTTEEITGEVNKGMTAILEQFITQITPAEQRDSDFTILLAHGSVDNCTIGEQPRPLAHDVLIPIKQFAEYYDYIALGHIHKSQTMLPNAHYCGSLIRQGFGEEQENKGVLIGEFLEPHGIPHMEFVLNPFSRIYRTLNHTQLDPVPEDKTMVYRIKDTIPEDAVCMVMPLVQRLVQELPFVQVNLEVENPDRIRDSGMNNQMDSHQAVARCLERDGTGEPLLSFIKELHNELVTEGTT